MQLLLNALIAGSFAALIAGGLSLVYGILGIFNLALGQLALVGGYSTWWLHDQVGLSLPLAVPGGVIIGGAVTAISFEIGVAPFYKLHQFLPLVSTIALSMILDGLLLLFFHEDPKSILLGGMHTIDIGDGRISYEQIALVILTFLLLCAAAYVFHSTSFGRKIRATVQHSEAAQGIGISSALFHRIVFIASGVLACLGGIYIGIDQNLTPVLGFPITIKAYAALIAGGKDSFWGTILCAYMIALFEQLAVGVPWFGGSYIPAGFQSVVALVVIIVVLLVRPTGLFSRRTRLA